MRDTRNFFSFSIDKPRAWVYNSGVSKYSEIPIGKERKL